MGSRRCNWRCYEAKSDECRCQCNGVNHGVGAEQARENFRRLGLLWNSSPIRHVTVRKSRKRRVAPEQGWLFSSLSELELDVTAGVGSELPLKPLPRCSKPPI